MTVESRIIRINPNDVVNISYGARSLSLTITAGNVTVAIGVAPGVVVPTGLSHTWAVDGPDELLSQPFVFTADALGSGYIIETRE